MWADSALDGHSRSGCSDLSLRTAFCGLSWLLGHLNLFVSFGLLQKQTHTDMPIPKYCRHWPKMADVLGFCPFLAFVVLVFFF